VRTEIGKNEGGRLTRRPWRRNTKMASRFTCRAVMVRRCVEDDLAHWTAPKWMKHQRAKLCLSLTLDGLRGAQFLTHASG
jgi:hypothetical protein